ncbi:MAG: hypothetical protein IJN83_01225 [Clostridia bacterium]|nr:hypothetical protein [Clostridia bacterium]
MQRTAPTSLPQRREGNVSPALTMASRIRAEQGPERAAQYLSAMEPFLAPGERTYIAYTLGLPMPQPVQQSYSAPQQQPNMGPLGSLGGLGNMGGLGNIGNIMQIMQLMNSLQGNQNGQGANPLMQMLGSLMGGGNNGTK